MKRTAFDLGALQCRIHESQIEGRVVADQNGAAAVVGLQLMAHLPEDALDGLALRQRRAQGMVGINAGDAERCRIQSRAGEGLYVKAVSSAAGQCAAGIDVNEYRRNFQQGIGARIEATGLHVDHDGEKTAEATAHERGGCRAVTSSYSLMIAARDHAPGHLLTGPQRHQGLAAEVVGVGTCHGSATRVMKSGLRGKP